MRMDAVHFLAVAFIVIYAKMVDITFQSSPPITQHHAIDASAFQATPDVSAKMQQNHVMDTATVLGFLDCTKCLTITWSRMKFFVPLIPICLGRWFNHTSWKIRICFEIHFWKTFLWTKTHLGGMNIVSQNPECNQFKTTPANSAWHASTIPTA